MSELTMIDDLLLAAGLNVNARQKVIDCAAEQLRLASGELPVGLHRWRLPAGVDPSDWFVGVDISPESSADGFVRVLTTATECLHSQAVMEV